MTRVGFEGIERMDEELARAARGAGRSRYAVGVGLEALARAGGHHALGFSSLEAYALERCGRSARWVQETRGLVRRLSSFEDFPGSSALPGIEAALTSGRIGFSMAQVVARLATADDEEHWLEAARTRTVRQMAAILAERSERSDPASASEPDLCTLTVTVPQEDAWVFECTRLIVRHGGDATAESVVEALVAEGTTSLLARLPRGTDFQAPGDATLDSRQRDWEVQREQWRQEAEVLCEERVLVWRDAGAETEGHGRRDAGGGTAGPARRDVRVALGFDFDGPIRHIDEELRRAAAALATRDLDLGELAEAFFEADGWRRLGYATSRQYAKERLGMSLSSLRSKRALARKTVELPELGAAVRSGALGYEAAERVASIASRETLPAWLHRAGERTAKHLREEVHGAKLLARLAAGTTGPVHPLPPTEAMMRDLHAMESAVVSGAVFTGTDASTSGGSSQAGSLAVRQMSAPCERLLAGSVQTLLAQVFEREGDSWFVRKPELAPGEGRTSRLDPRGRVTLRLRVSRELRDYYRALERLFVRHGPSARRRSFLSFLCASFVETWAHTLGGDGAYESVYARDRYTCTSPVCSRIDVTPHHLRYRSHGGGDEDENVTTLCTWCHLEGIHGGRLVARGPASRIEWHLGDRAHRHTVIEGRRCRTAGSSLRREAA